MDQNPKIWGGLALATEGGVIASSQSVKQWWEGCVIYDFKIESYT